MSTAMFPVGMSVLYGRTGVCRVEGIGTPPAQKKGGPCCYKLRALFSCSGELIYIPVDTAVSIRPLIGKSEASRHLEQLAQMRSPSFSSRKPSELAAHYQELLATSRLEDCLLLLKEVFLKEQDLARRKKKLGQVDTRYQKVAERLVCEEFAVALQTTPEAVKRQLYSVMGQSAV